MKTAAILLDRKSPANSLDLEPFIRTTLDKVKTLTDTVYFLSKNKALADKLGVPAIDFETSHQFLSFISNELPDTSVMLLNSCSPLLDVEATRGMLADHQRYVFDYTYPENLPDGLIPEIIDSGMADFIRSTIPESVGFFQHSIADLFRQDLSSYDCNIYITDSRLIQYRINFVPDTHNNTEVLCNIVKQAGSEHTISSLEKWIMDNPSVIRQKPTYYEIEITTERESGDMFAGKLINREGEMKPETFRLLLKEISRYSRDPSVSIGLYSEPFLHSSIQEIILILKEFPEIKFLFESRCLILETKAVEKALELPNVSVIFDLSFVQADMFSKYKKPINTLRPLPALSAVEAMIQGLPNRERVYVQSTRTTVNDQDLMKFYEKWKDFQDRIVIKKPDLFGGRLAQYRVINLSPVKRFACLHLKHDMCIFLDGTVPLCKQDCAGENPAGNIFKDGIENCWKALYPIYERQWKGEFQTPTLCQGCDEWWVFNF